MTATTTESPSKAADGPAAVAAAPPVRSSFAAGLVRSLRPHQWFKNVFLFAALVFAQRLGDPAAVGLAVAGFVVFCALSSSVYLVNDIRDLEQDRLHPRKRSRPIAAGIVPVPAAGALAAALLAAGLGGAWLLGAGFFALALTYAALSLGYCFGLKHVVILDVMILASGYTIRAAAGAEAIHVSISNWLLMCTSLLALFLGFCKRRQELTSLEGKGVAHRAVLARYSEPFLDQMIAVVTAGTVISYLLYAFSEEVAGKLHTRHLALTVPFVLYGIFRYFYLVHMLGEGGHPTREFLGDRPLLVNFFLYALTVVGILYLLPRTP
jgi:4-hydroxybenzoate polyprenyltransferase